MIFHSFRFCPLYFRLLLPPSISLSSGVRMQQQQQHD